MKKMDEALMSLQEHLKAREEEVEFFGAECPRLVREPMVVETPLLPGPMFLVVLQAPEGAVKDDPFPYCLEIYGYTDKMGLRLIAIYPLKSLEHVNERITILQKAAAADREDFDGNWLHKLTGTV